MPIQMAIKNKKRHNGNKILQYFVTTIDRLYCLRLLVDNVEVKLYLACNFKQKIFQIYRI